MISGYKSLAEIDAVQKISIELFEKKYPDKQQRDTINNKRQSMIMGHTDNIVQEVPSLRK